MKSGNLNFLEPSGPLQACNGTALPFTVLTSRRNAWKKIFIFPLRYYANCVSTTLTVLILHNVESVYLFYSNPTYIYVKAVISLANVRLLGVRVRIPPGAWIFVCCERVCFQVEVSASV